MALLGVTFVAASALTGAQTTSTVPIAGVLLAPTNVIATAGAQYSQKINLSWTASAGNVYGYKIYRSSGGCSNFSLWYSVYDGVTTFLDTGLTPNYPYCYRVTAMDSSIVESGYSSDASATSPSGYGTCSSLELVFANNKTTYTGGEMVNYTYTCSPGGTGSYAEVQLVKPDGSVTTYNTLSGSFSTQSMGFGTDNLIAGVYTLRVCFTTACTGAGLGGSAQFTVNTPVPGAGAPEPSNNDAGAWAAVDIATGEITNVAVCTRSVCGINGEWHGYVPPGSWATGSVWWPTSKRYIWQVPGQAGYSSGTFNFNTYIFTVPGGTIYNGQFTATAVTPTPTLITPTSTPTATTTQTWTYVAPTPAPTQVYAPTQTPATSTSIVTPVPYVTPITIPPVTFAPTSTLAQPTSTPIAQCLQAGGVWCYTESPQSNVGYCATEKSGCERKPETSQAEERRAELQSQEQFFAERRAILQDLRAMERLVKQDVVDVDAKLLKAYKEKLLALKPGEEKDISALQNYREKIVELRGDEEPPPVAPLFADHRAEAKALKQMKLGLRQFERYLATIETKVTRLKKAGITVDASIKEAITVAKTMAQQVRAAKTYDDVRDVADSMPDVGQALNDSIPRLEEFLRLPRVFSVLDKKITESDRVIKQTAAVAKKLKLDVTDNIAEMQALLAEAKEAVAAVKNGAVATDDLVVTLEETVLDKVDGIFDLAAHIKTVDGIRQAINRAAADSKRYKSRILRLEKAKEDMQTASALLEQFNEHSSDLKDLSKRKLTPEIGDQIIDSVRSMGDIRDELEDILRLSKPDPLEAEIKKLFSTSGEKLKPFDVEKLEQGLL